MQLLLILQYPILAHIAVLTGVESLKLAAFGLLLVGIMLKGIVARDPGALLVTAALSTAVGVAYWFSLLTLLLYLLPALVPVVFLVVFGATLRPGAEPLVTAIGEQARGPLTAEMRHYTRRVTEIWTLVFILLTIDSLIALTLLEGVIRSWILNILNPILISTFFIVEFAFRKHKFKSHAHPTFLEYLDIVRTAKRS